LILFELSDIVFLGGSLVVQGGHNPIEPSLHNCAILTGSNLFNWDSIYNDMIKDNACIKVKSLEDLELNVSNLLNNKSEMDMLKINSFNFAKKQFIDTNFLDKTINKYMKN
jgi:3-deoxy-D-manno-octulosonic-acid transferase